MIIICTGKIANTTVGHIDHAMAYPSGFQKLGHEVYLMEHVGSGRCVDSNNQKVPFDKWDGRLHFETVARSYGIWPRCCLIYQGGKAAYGMPLSEAVKVAKSCDLLITRSGQIDKAPEIFDNARCRAFFDGNPGNTQVLYSKDESGFEILDRYQHLFTLGLNIGAKACGIPTGGLTWIPALRPVVLPMWPVRANSDSKRFTTISTWKGRATFHLQGKYSGEKSDNWLKFIELPNKTGCEFGLAMKLDAVDHQTDRKIFQKNGWQLMDPGKLRNLDDYRNFIGQSRAEFSVAHNRYAKFSTGWFSDRSALYLASGKPVLVQSTGIEQHLPTGKGLLMFSTMDEAISGIEEINRDYLDHCQAARQIAEEYFDSDKVLTKILNQIDSCRS